MTDIATNLASIGLTLNFPESDALLLESGDALLLESTDRILLETA
jgi:hypothetical protein